MKGHNLYTISHHSYHGCRLNSQKDKISIRVSIYTGNSYRGTTFLHLWCWGFHFDYFPACKRTWIRICGYKWNHSPHSKNMKISYWNSCFYRTQSSISHKVKACIAYRKCNSLLNSRLLWKSISHAHIFKTTMAMAMILIFLPAADYQQEENYNREGLQIILKFIAQICNQLGWCFDWDISANIFAVIRTPDAK